MPSETSQRLPLALDLRWMVILSQVKVTEKSQFCRGNKITGKKKSWNKSQEIIILFKLSAESLPVFPIFNIILSEHN